VPLSNFKTLGVYGRIIRYDVCVFEVVEDHLGKDEFHFDCGLLIYGWGTILVRTEIYAMNHYGQFMKPQNSNFILCHLLV
jgi:hypothetical protein